VYFSQGQKYNSKEDLRLLYTLDYMLFVIENAASNLTSVEESEVKLNFV